MNTLRLIFLSAALSQVVGVAAIAQPAAPPGGPPSFARGEKDIKGAPAGAYELDATHASVIALVSHMGYSNSVFRFDKVKGSLTWDPAAVANSKLSVTVEPGSIATNVAGFAKELGGPMFLNVQAFPEATFVSTAFRQTAEGKGQVDGQFTLMGKTRPLTFDVNLVGAGKGFGKPRLGVNARATINPQDFGISPMLPGPIQLIVDVEFVRTP